MLLWTGSQFATSLHLLTAEHGLCPEHGDLIELGHDHEVTEAAASEVASRAVGVTGASISAQVTHSNEEHCQAAVPLQLRPPDATSRLFVSPPRVPLADPIATGNDHVACPPCAAWLIAPKASPPVARA